LLEISNSTLDNRNSPDKANAKNLCAYSEAALNKMAGRSIVWIEEDQKQVDQEYAWIGSELKRLVQEGKDPSEAEAQGVAKRFLNLIQAFTQGDPEIENGLKKWWENFELITSEDKPRLVS